MKRFSLALLAICFTTTFAIHMQNFIVSTDSNYSCLFQKNALETIYWMVDERRKRPLISQQNVKS